MPDTPLAVQLAALDGQLMELSVTFRLDPAEIANAVPSPSEITFADAVENITRGDRNQAISTLLGYVVESTARGEQFQSQLAAAAAVEVLRRVLAARLSGSPM